MKHDDFTLWLKDPVTQWVFNGVLRAAEAEKAEWMRQSWEAGEADPMALCELRTRALALTELRDNDFETWTNWNADHD